jgi:two-component system LytT family response regulator
MSKIRTLIVDDEPLAREGIRMLLQGDPEIHIVDECVDGNQAVAMIRALEPELVFLDIQMPEMSGFDVIEAICDGWMPVFVFVTAFDKYALRAFDANAVDYLLKPFTAERFSRALARAKTQLARDQGSAMSHKLLAVLEGLHGGSKYIERLVVRSGRRIYLLSAADIDWIEAAENYVNLHRGKEIRLAHYTMTSLEARLDPAAFLRVHRRAIVNLKRIKELQLHSHGEYVIILENGTRLMSGRKYRANIEAFFRDRV